MIKKIQNAFHVHIPKMAQPMAHHLNHAMNEAAKVATFNRVKREEKHDLHEMEEHF